MTLIWFYILEDLTLIFDDVNADIFLLYSGTIILLGIRDSVIWWQSGWKLGCYIIRLCPRCW